MRCTQTIKYVLIITTHTQKEPLSGLPYLDVKLFGKPLTVYTLSCCKLYPYCSVRVGSRKRLSC